MKILKSFLVFSILLVMSLGVLCWLDVPEISSAAYSDIFEEISDDIDLPTYSDASDAHGESYNEEGLQEITSAVYYLLDFVKYILAGVAVLMIIVSAYRLLVAGKSAEEEITKQKVYLTWATVGLIVVMSAEPLVKELFFGEEGQILMGDEQLALEFGYRTNKFIQGLYTMIEVFVGAIAVFMIAYEGFRIVSVGYQEEVVTKAKNHIFWSIIALFLIGISEFLVREVIFPYVPGESVEPNMTEGKFLLVSATNFVSGLVGFVAVAMLIYGGYMYVTAGANEENEAKAKKAIFGAIIGIILAAAAFAITSTIIPLQA